MRNLLHILVLFIVSTAGYSQTVLLDENFQNGIPTTWSTFDLDGGIPDSSVSYINEAWIGYETAFDTCAISTSYYGSDTSQLIQSMDYLVSPKLDLLSFGHILTWQSKSFDANYLESYKVLLSTTDSLPQSFTNTIKIVSNDSPYWKTFSANLFLDGFANQSVYIAFQNTSTNQFILGVDNVKVTTNDVASVSDIKESPVKVYPNPVTTSLNVNVNDGTVYQLYSFDGKKILGGVVKSKFINVSDLNTGIYILQIQIGESVYSKKIIKL